MAIWSLTQERVEKLLRQIGDKEMEIDALQKLTPKDIWMEDLDAFVVEWNTQLEDEENRAKKIAKTVRRASQKLGIGAPKGGKRKKKRMGDGDSDDSESDYGPAKKKAKPKTGGLLSYLRTEDEPKKPSATQALKNGAASGMKQTGMLGYLKKEASAESVDLAEPMDVDRPDPSPEPAAAAPKRGRPAGSKNKEKPKLEPVDSDSDSDVFAAVAKEAEKKKPAETVTTSRVARGAAKKPAKYVLDEDSHSDSDDMDDLLDVSNMVKTLGGATSARSLLPTATRPSSNGSARPEGTAAAPFKAANRHGARKGGSTELDDPDETNYEGLMPVGSPHKPAPRNVNDTMFGSDDEDEFGFGIKKKSAPKATAKPGASGTSKHKTAAAKPPSAAVAKKANQLSPAAKAYAARLGKPKELPSKPASKVQKKPIAVDSDEDEDMGDADQLANDILSGEDDEPTPKPAARPGRRAAAKPAKYVVSDDDDSDESSEADFDDSE